VKPKDGPLGMKFVPLPKATFYMGGGGGKAGKKTEIKGDFEIAVYRVTQGQWQELMGNNPSYFSRQGGGKDKVKDLKDEELKQFPVEMVSWDDVQEFAKKLDKMEEGKGYVYRLPTAAGWEYACRGGATTREECSYHFYSEKPTNDLSSKQANCRDLVSLGKGEKGPFLRRPTKVGSYVPNKLGLYDMHGNVWQCTGSPMQDGWLARVFRGGSGTDYSPRCRAASCNSSVTTVGFSTVGFCLARVPVSSK
jgi:formylglycine-generating enzyme required for sulfatase activity